MNSNNPEPLAPLHIEVYTSPARSFTSSAIPEGPGDEATWSPSSATLIYGDRDAILVDVPAPNEQVDKLADWIEGKGKRLAHVYITHGHGDHWLGLARLTKRFPGVTGLATADVLDRVRLESTHPGLSAYWAGVFPGEIPLGDEQVLPELLDGDTIDLEGNELRVIRIGRADTADSTVLYASTLGAVVTGDLVYNEVHMMTGEAGEQERADWIASLGEIAKLNPRFVVSGHKKVENDNDPKTIAESQQYLRDFSRIADEETTSTGIVQRMVELYPSWQNRRTLWYSARAEIARRV